jgi:hypothetical protein
LLPAQNPEAPGSGTEAHDVHEADEVDPLVIEALPAGARGPLAESSQVLLAVVHEDVVLSGDVEDLADLGPFEDLGDRVIFIGFRQVGQVAGVDQEVRRLRQCVDLSDRLLERGGHVLVRLLGEADVAIADLDKREVARLCPCKGFTERAGREYAAAGRPDEPRAGPGHALEETAPVHAVSVVITDFVIFHWNESFVSCSAEEPGRRQRFSTMTRAAILG